MNSMYNYKTVKYNKRYELTHEFFVHSIQVRSSKYIYLYPNSR